MDGRGKKVCHLPAQTPLQRPVKGQKPSGGAGNPAGPCRGKGGLDKGERGFACARALGKARASLVVLSSALRKAVQALAPALVVAVHQRHQALVHLDACTCMHADGLSEVLYGRGCSAAFVPSRVVSAMQPAARMHAGSSTGGSRIVHGHPHEHACNFILFYSCTAAPQLGSAPHGKRRNKPVWAGRSTPFGGAVSS